MLLSPEQEDFRRLVRDFARREVMPSAAGRDASGEDPSEIFARLGAMGALGITVPPQFGGLGLDTVTLVLAIEELGYADASVGSVVAGHYLGLEGLRAFGDHAMKERYLPQLAQGGLRAAFALTEPDAGSDIAGLRSTAVRDGSRWRIRGSKIFISSAREADIMVLFAKTDPAAGFRGISAFVVPTDEEHITYSAPLAKLGCRGERAYEVTLDDAVVAADALIGEAGGGGRIAMAVLNPSRIDVAALASGVARRALDLAVDYSGIRVQFGRPIGEFQAVQLALGQMDALVETARLATFAAAQSRDAGDDIRRIASIAKYVASENCSIVVDKSMQIHGGYGYMQDAEIERIYRDCRLFRIYEGTSDMQLLTVARSLTRRHDRRGHPA
jgi:alkylation response protein AidB-like acyl-CoA dehydrogenase